METSLSHISVSQPVAQPERALEAYKEVDVVMTQEQDLPTVHSDSPEELAEELYEVSVDKGIDEAFIELAQEEEVDEIVDETSKETKQDETLIDEETIDEEKVEITNEFQSLVIKARELEEEKNAMEEELKAKDATIDKSLDVMLKLAESLKKLIDEEEDESKKVGLLEMFVSTLTGFMQAAFVPEQDDAFENKMTENKSKPQPKKASSQKNQRMEMLKTLQQQRGVNVEIPAA